MDYDLIVIGGGPAGYVAAIRASQHGKKVACIENDRAGGTCLNWGCIPTKSLLRNAEIYHLMKERAGEFGLTFDHLSYDWSKVVARSRGVADRLAGGIEMLFKKNKVDYIRGTGSIPKAGVVSVEDAKGNVQTYDTANILVATGVKPREMPGLPFDAQKVISSRQAMVLERQPQSIAIIGAGAIGIEFAYFFNAFGTDVTVIEMMPQILPIEDEEVSKGLEKSLTKSGIKILTGSKVTQARVAESGVTLDVEGSKGGQVQAELCLVAIGVSPVLPAGVTFALDTRGYIQTGNRYETSVAGVYAAGDIIGPPWLAHVASYEAIQAVDGIFTGHQPRKVNVFPGCTYCQPQVASVGLTERAAKEKGINYKVGKFPFMVSGKALAVGESEGFVKILFGAEHGEVLGAHILGNEATELIAEMGLAVSLEATRDDIEATIHAHPTLSEAVHEATGVAFGEAIHI